MALNTPLAVVAALSATAVLSLDVVRFAPEDGSEVERTITWTESTSSSEVTVTLDGEETSEVPTPFATVERTLSIESKDQFVRSTPGKQLEFVRRFGPITLESSAELGLETIGGTAELSFEGEGGSELEDVGVRFVWNEEDEVWERSFADDYEGSDELLEGLSPTTELIALLSDEEELAVGDSWDIEVDMLADILVPGGRPPIDFESDLQALEGVLDPLELPGVFQCLVGDGEGDIGARVKSIEDGIAVIELTVDVTISSDKLEHVGALVEAALPDGATAEIQISEYTTAIDGKGELAWDLAESRMSSFRFDAKVEVEVVLGVDVTVEGSDVVFEMRETREGEISVEIE